MSSIISGITSCFIDGNSFDITDSGEWSAATVERTAVVALNGNVYYQERPKTGWIQVTVFNKAGQDITTFNAMTANTVVLTLATGENITANNAFQTGDLSVSLDNNSFSVKFESQNVTLG